MKSSNRLIHESSPYLRQHADNPVDWYPWSEEAWEKARKENKLVLISIGYSSCHWCHVMEHESFENDSTAQIMNEHFVCIKVDREERPDVDQVYMTAVQLMTGSGGWPLNCFTLPDGRPVYGGTYFPNTNWNQVLIQLSNFYRDNQAKAEEYAKELTEGIRQTEIVNIPEEKVAFSKADLAEIISSWKKMLDNREGGPDRVPKFPLPNNYEFLMRVGHEESDNELLNHVDLTLRKMAYGGIYDQIGGGFARYSTDADWKVPHFEKMLYDNAQLVSLYAKAYQRTGNSLYQEIVEGTCEFIEREMTSPEGGFYSALDADSEGKEGKYYIWTEEELKKLSAHLLNGKGFEITSDYYNVNKKGYWEDENFILLRNDSDAEVAKRHGLSETELHAFIKKLKSVLLHEREKRVRPGLDDKILCSWNSMMVVAYCDAYRAFYNAKYLNAAIKCMNLILKKMKTPDGALFHTYKEGKASINGFMEDYAFAVAALIALYNCTFNEEWLQEARKISDYAIEHFYDKERSMFWFTSKTDKPLIMRKMEIADNVTPASNSVMAHNLHALGIYFDNKEYISMSENMLINVRKDMLRYGSSYSNWAILALNSLYPFREIVITGKDKEQFRIHLQQKYLPGTIFAGTGKGEGSISLLKDRIVEGKSLIYICENRVCKIPVDNIDAALKILNKKK
ncbi:MAG: thioredoxin domain-containing protein [Bacteroidetes bacterium]|nr:MAG: thioredoxin domain-containing protein [Bacteroidota bacterium]REK05333.1 MAG: thioredoxin domain-containing protein [Bacteroidota bacterium]REK36579.1 MAG: thioredoxin domain-containing protein [Bacteroidota bacterium]REK51121.1 MAG: thioredoxin domain-containing protein [Bacteroidota bacterium]